MYTFSQRQPHYMGSMESESWLGNLATTCPMCKTEEKFSRLVNANLDFANRFRYYKNIFKGVPDSSLTRGCPDYLSPSRLSSFPNRSHTSPGRYDSPSFEYRGYVPWTSFNSSPCLDNRGRVSAIRNDLDISEGPGLGLTAPNSPSNQAKSPFRPGGRVGESETHEFKFSENPFNDSGSTAPPPHSRSREKDDGDSDTFSDLSGSDSDNTPSAPSSGFINSGFGSPESTRKNGPSQGPGQLFQEEGFKNPGNGSPEVTSNSPNTQGKNNELSSLPSTEPPNEATSHTKPATAEVDTVSPQQDNKPTLPKTPGDKKRATGNKQTQIPDPNLPTRITAFSGDLTNPDGSYRPRGRGNGNEPSYGGQSSPSGQSSSNNCPMPTKGTKPRNAASSTGEPSTGPESQENDNHQMSNNSPDPSIGAGRESGTAIPATPDTPSSPNPPGEKSIRAYPTLSSNKTSGSIIQPNTMHPEFTSQTSASPPSQLPQDTAVVEPKKSKKSKSSSRFSQPYKYGTSSTIPGSSAQRPSTPTIPRPRPAVHPNLADNKPPKPRPIAPVTPVEEAALIPNNSRNNTAGVNSAGTQLTHSYEPSDLEQKPTETVNIGTTPASALNKSNTRASVERREGDRPNRDPQDVPFRTPIEKTEGANPLQGGQNYKSEYPVKPDDQDIRTPPLPSGLTNGRTNAASGADTSNNITPGLPAEKPAVVTFNHPNTLITNSSQTPPPASNPNKSGNRTGSTENLEPDKLNDTKSEATSQDMEPPHEIHHLDPSQDGHQTQTKDTEQDNVSLDDPDIRTPKPPAALTKDDNNIATEDPVQAPTPRTAEPVPPSGLPPGFEHRSDTPPNSTPVNVTSGLPPMTPATTANNTNLSPAVSSHEPAFTENVLVKRDDLHPSLTHVQTDPQSSKPSVKDSAVEPHIDANKPPSLPKNKKIQQKVHQAPAKTVSRQSTDPNFNPKPASNRSPVQPLIPERSTFNKPVTLNYKRKPSFPEPGKKQRNLLLLSKPSNSVSSIRPTSPKLTVYSAAKPKSRPAKVTSPPLAGRNRLFPQKQSPACKMPNKKPGTNQSPHFGNPTPKLKWVLLPEDLISGLDLPEAACVVSETPKTKLKIPVSPYRQQRPPSPKNIPKSAPHPFKPPGAITDQELTSLTKSLEKMRLQCSTNREFQELYRLLRVYLLSNEPPPVPHVNPNLMNLSSHQSGGSHRSSRPTQSLCSVNRPSPRSWMYTNNQSSGSSDAYQFTNNPNSCSYQPVASTSQNYSCNYQQRSSSCPKINVFAQTDNGISPLNPAIQRHQTPLYQMPSDSNNPPDSANDNHNSAEDKDKQPENTLEALTNFAFGSQLAPSPPPPAEQPTVPERTERAESTSTTASEYSFFPSNFEALHLTFSMAQSPEIQNLHQQITRAASSRQSVSRFLNKSTSITTETASNTICSSVQQNPSILNSVYSVTKPKAPSSSVVVASIFVPRKRSTSNTSTQCHPAPAPSKPSMDSSFDGSVQPKRSVRFAEPVVQPCREDASVGPDVIQSSIGMQNCVCSCHTSEACDNLTPVEIYNQAMSSYRAARDDVASSGRNRHRSRPPSATLSSGSIVTETPREVPRPSSSEATVIKNDRL